MKATELRIGNWVEIQGLESKIILVDTEGCICENEYCEDFENNNITQNLQPIPLTEEWLTRFGFSLGYDGWYSICMPSGIFLAIEEDMYEVTVGQGVDFSHTLIELNYVHQLQNLYYALTGEELNQNN